MKMLKIRGISVFGDDQYILGPPPLSGVFGTPSLRPKIYLHGKMVYGRDRLVRLEFYVGELMVRSTKVYSVEW